MYRRSSDLHEDVSFARAMAIASRVATLTSQRQGLLVEEENLSRENLKNLAEEVAFTAAMTRFDGQGARKTLG